jgi:VWFA-related protein
LFLSRVAATFQLKVFAAVTLIAVSSAVCWAQTPPTPSVAIPVIVTDQKGEPVSGLTEKNFSLERAQKTDKIAAVKEVKTSNSELRRYPPSGLKATNIFKTEDQSARRVFLLVVDEPHLEMPQVQRFALRKETVSALVKALRAGEQGGLASYDGSAITIVHDFASPPDLLFAAVNKLGAAEVPNADSQQVPAISGPRPEGFDAEFDRLTKFLQGPPIGATLYSGCRVPIKICPTYKGFGIEPLRAMESLSHVLAGVPGNKALIWITSYPTYRLSAKNGTVKSLFDPISAREAEKVRAAERTLIAISPDVQEQGESLTVFRTLSIAGVSVYPVRVGGIPRLASKAGGDSTPGLLGDRAYPKKPERTVQVGSSECPIQPPGTDVIGLGPSRGCVDPLTAGLHGYGESLSDRESLSHGESLPVRDERLERLDATLSRLADFTGGHFDPYRLDVWEALSDTQRRMADYYSIEVTPRDSMSTTVIRVGAKHNVSEAASPRLHELQFRPLLPRKNKVIFLSYSRVICPRREFLW